MKHFYERYFLNTWDIQLNLDDPKTFSEKMQWMKLYDRKPIYTTMVDKYEAKNYLADRIDSKYIIPNLRCMGLF